MVALVTSNSVVHTQESLHDRFLAMLPQIRRQAFAAFQSQRSESREELIQEVVVNCYRAWVLLVRRGKESVAYPTPLAQFAIRQVREGRRVGGRQCTQDILSPSARRLHGFTVERFDQKDWQTGVWKEQLVEDRRAGPAETAAARLDLAAWLRTLSKRNRRIAQALSVGEATAAVAQKFGLSAGRVSQLRVWLREHWETFQGDRQSVVVAA
jgi:DNA-directed RNA polymerase specialized sigma24 family protein